jgi:PPOX class probable F420-dependent enzyme
MTSPGIILDAEDVIVPWNRSMPMTTFPESHQDLLKAEVAMLATIGQDGYPQVTALWFLFDEDGTLKLSLNNSRQKVKNLQAHPECTLFILDTANPYRTLEVRARAEIMPDVDYAFAKKLGAKYGGTDLSTRDRPGETRVVVLLQPIKVNTWGS